MYLEHQSRADATVAEIIAVGGTVTVRADLADELDVERLFIESIAVFGGVDVVAHTTTDNASLLYDRAPRRLRKRGAIVSTSGSELMTPQPASMMRTRGIKVGRVPPEGVLTFLDRWRRQEIG